MGRSPPRIYAHPEFHSAMEEIGRSCCFQPIIWSHWALTVLFVPLLCWGSESMSGFVSRLAEEPGYHFSSGPRSEILETPRQAFCYSQGSDTRALNNGFGFTVAWSELSLLPLAMHRGSNGTVDITRREVSPASPHRPLPLGKPSCPITVCSVSDLPYFTLHEQIPSIRPGHL